MSSIDPREVLRNARQLVKAHRYAEALDKYMWFHDHALDTDRSLAGVRLSYAISEWIDLGDVYPPALSELESVRDKKTELLMDGTQDARLFQDVESINEALGQAERTPDLFKIIAAGNRGLAQKCFPIALESLVRTKEFSIARSFLSDPTREIDRLATPFKVGIQSTPPVPLEIDVKEMLTRFYADRVGMVLQVLRGAGEEVEADQIREYALECVPDEELRDMIAKGL